MRAYYAHSVENASEASWQCLKDHLQSTAQLAGHFAQDIGAGKAAFLAGLLHDLGKYSEAFQARLRGSPVKVDHSTAGAAVLGRLARSPEDIVMAEIVSYAIAGHHAGLPDHHGTEGGSLTSRLHSFPPESISQDWLKEISPHAEDLLPLWASTGISPEDAPFQLGFLGRMIFSCLVDADFKDTESFYAQREGRDVPRDWDALQDMLPRFVSAFDGHISRLGGKASQGVDQTRSKILRHVRSCASQSPGIFSMTVPTGGGKTLASLGFALDHARIHGHKRIIYALPFTSIIDQTVSTFREILGDGYVLEHHSAIEEQGASKNPERNAKEKLVLAMEDWAAPVVVTTNVQLFESLFAARPSRCRKLHNVAQSIIILDEAQTLPRHLLIPCVRAIHELVRNYGCSVVFCTATQPALDEQHFALPQFRELAPDPSCLAQELKRTTLRHVGSMTDEKLVEDIASHRQALVIVNSRAHALALYRKAQSGGLSGLVHLTTRQYAAHRREILSEIRRRLEAEEDCRVIATSLVEAGVDLDFPRVWRAEAGLDQVAQAAGRCNRGGRRPLGGSIVTIFNAPDNPPPPEIRGLCGDMARMSFRFEDLLSPEAIRAFFQEVYWRTGDSGLDRERIMEKFMMDATGTDFSYRTVAESFRMIESGLVPVIIEGDANAKEAISQLHFREVPSGKIARKLQPYLVLVPPKARDKLIANGHVAFEAQNLRGDQFAVLKSGSLYTPEVGLLWENADYLNLENTII